MNYRYGDNFSYLDKSYKSSKNDEELNKIPCDIDVLYRNIMKQNEIDYDLKTEDTKDNAKNIENIFKLNKTNHLNMIKNFSNDIEISKPVENIEILNSIYGSKYDSGILDENKSLSTQCMEEQIEAIKNCEINCSRNECNNYYLDIALDSCTINNVKQKYGITFCKNNKNNCVDIQKKYISECLKDCSKCNFNTSDITLNKCLIDYIPQIYGESFCSRDICHTPTDPNNIRGYDIIETNIDPGHGRFNVEVECSIGYKVEDGKIAKAEKCEMPGSEYTLSGCTKIKCEELTEDMCNSDINKDTCIYTTETNCINENNKVRFQFFVNNSDDIELLKDYKELINSNQNNPNPELLRSVREIYLKKISEILKITDFSLIEYVNSGISKINTNNKIKADEIFIEVNIKISTEKIEELYNIYSINNDKVNFVLYWDYCGINQYVETDPSFSFDEFIEADSSGGVTCQNCPPKFTKHNRDKKNKGNTLCDYSDYKFKYNGYNYCATDTDMSDNTNCQHVTYPGGNPTVHFKFVDTTNIYDNVIEVARKCDSNNSCKGFSVSREDYYLILNNHDIYSKCIFNSEQPECLSSSLTTSNYYTYLQNKSDYEIYNVDDIHKLHSKVNKLSEDVQALNESSTSESLISDIRGPVPHYINKETPPYIYKTIEVK